MSLCHFFSNKIVVTCICNLHCNWNNFSKSTSAVASFLSELLCQLHLVCIHLCMKNKACKKGKKNVFVECSISVTQKLKTGAIVIYYILCTDITVIKSWLTMLLSCEVMWYHFTAVKFAASRFVLTLYCISCTWTWWFDFLSM